MNQRKYILTVLILTFYVGFTSCSNYTGDKSLDGKIIGDSSANSTQNTNVATTDSLTLQKNKLTKIYTQAIAEFIKAVYKKSKTSFDTLYFGKHTFGQADDFPDIELPKTIEKTQIRLIEPEVGQHMRAERKSFVYVNLMGWVDNKQAEFVFVVLANGAEHQYDYFINFNYNISSDSYELDRIELENYIQLSGQKPKRTTIYKDDKYVMDK
jgi:hypothetical protein